MLDLYTYFEVPTTGTGPLSLVTEFAFRHLRTTALKAAFPYVNCCGPNSNKYLIAIFFLFPVEMEYETTVRWIDLI